LRQGQLARILKIPRTYLSRIENNRLLPGPMMIPRIAAALAIPIAELLPGKPNRTAGGRSADADPIAAALLNQFVQLRSWEMEEVLTTARRMLTATGLRTAGGRLAPLEQSAVQRPVALQR
jgi:transcriptional regulator with XRE-family HTH domain